MDTWDLNRKFNVGNKVQPILESVAKSRKHLISQVMTQVKIPTPKPIISEKSHLGQCAGKNLKKKNILQMISR